MIAGGAGTFSAAGTVNVGSSTPKTTTQITGLFNATGYLTGHSTWAATAGCAPLGGSSPNNPKEGPGNATGSPSPVVLEPPFDPIIEETEMNQFKLSKVLLGFLNLQYEYIKSLFTSNPIDSILNK